jgi:hypothetical protein
LYNHSPAYCHLYNHSSAFVTSTAVRSSLCHSLLATFLSLLSPTLSFTTQEKLCCATLCCAPFSGCVSDDKTKHYVRTSWAVFYFWWVRVALVGIGSIAYYGTGGAQAGKGLLTILNLTAAAFLVYMLVNLINMYENIFEHCKNINGVGKAFLMKVSVGLITILSNIENIIVTIGGRIEVRGNNDDDAHDMTQRAYASLMLLIFCFLSFLALPSTSFCRRSSQ